MPGLPRRHLHLVRDGPTPGVYAVGFLLVSALMLLLAWAVAEWRVGVVLERWERAHQEGVTTPTIRVDCVNWKGDPFGIELPLLPKDAARVARVIEEGIAQPYSPVCTVK